MAAGFSETDQLTSGPAKLERSVEQAVGATSALLAVVITIAAGIVAGLRAHRPATAARAGLFAGLVSVVVVFCFAVVMTMTNLGVLATRPTIARSSPPATRPTCRPSSSATSWRQASPIW